ncbi:hypothetical protein MBLNU13_g05133t1 [Cladosporium sp. NU13]
MLNDELRHLDHAYVLIEALDRGEKTATTELLRDLAKLQKTSEHRLKILVSSPGTDEYSSILKSFCEIRVSPRRAELRPYIEKRIESSEQISEWCDRHEGLRFDIIDAVCDKADGMGLLAKLLMQILLDSTEQSLEGFCSMLKHLPDAMDDTYSMLWDRIQKRKGLGPALAIRIFTWVIYAKRPISMGALRHGLCAEDPSKSFPFSENDLTSTRTILPVCIGLIAEGSRGGNVGFVHHTAEQYFKKHPPQDRDVAHSTIASACMNYLLLTSRRLYSAPEFSTRVEIDDSDTQEVYDDFLGIYAGQHWGTHAETVQTKTKVAQLMQRFLSDQACVSRSASVVIAHFRWNWSQAFLQTPFNSADVRGLHLAAYYGLNYAIRAFLRVHPNEVSSDIDDFWSPLRFAVLDGKLETVDLLAEMGADVAQKDCRGNTTLIWLLALPFNEYVVEDIAIHGGWFHHGDVITLSLWEYLTGNWQDLNPPMVSRHILEHLARITPQVDAKGHLGRTALSHAAEAGIETVVAILLQRGADSSMLDDSGMNPLLWALQPSTARRKHYKHFYVHGTAKVHLGDYLILYTEDESTKSVVDSTASAAEAVCMAMIWPQHAPLLELETRDRSGRTALSLAAGQGLGIVVSQLLTLGADADTADDEELTPLAWALAPPILPMNLTFSHFLVEDRSIAHLGISVHFPCSSKTFKLHESARYDLSFKSSMIADLIVSIKNLDRHLSPTSGGLHLATPMQIQKQYILWTPREPGFMYLHDLAVFETMSGVMQALQSKAQLLGHELQDDTCFRVAVSRRVGLCYNDTAARDEARVHLGNAIHFKYGDTNESLEPEFALLRGPKIDQK